MNRYFILLLLAALTGTVYSQQFDLHISKPDFNFGSTTKHAIFGHDDKHYYVFKQEQGRYFIEKLDIDLNLLKKEPLKLYDGFRVNDFEHIVHFQGQILVFSSRRRVNNVTLYYQVINKETLQSEFGFSEITTIENINGNWATFNFALSRRENMLAISSHIKLTFSKVQFNEFYVYGKDFELVWERKDRIEFAGIGPRDNKFLIDEEGSLTVLSLVKKAGLFDHFREVKNIYKIYRYTDNGKMFQEYPITLVERYIRGIKMVASDNGDLICAGLYSEVFRYGVRGAFYFRISAEDGRIYDSFTHDFDSRVIEQLAETNEVTMSGTELISYELTDFVIRSNGKVVLLAEQLYEQSYNTYNNIIVHCFDTTGIAFWTTVVPKRQDFDLYTLEPLGIYLPDYREHVRESGYHSTRVENLCSYALLAPEERSELVVFYNNHIRNLDEDGRRRSFANPKNSYLAAFFIDEYGNASHQVISQWTRRQQFPEPLRYYHRLDNRIIIPAFRGRKYTYKRIELRF